MWLGGRDLLRHLQEYSHTVLGGREAVPWMSQSINEALGKSPLSASSGGVGKPLIAALENDIKNHEIYRKLLIYANLYFITF